MSATEFWPWMKTSEARYRMLAMTGFVQLLNKVRDDHAARLKAIEEARMERIKAMKNRNQPPPPGEI